MPLALALLLVRPAMEDLRGIRIPLMLLTPAASDVSHVGDPVYFQVAEETQVGRYRLTKGTPAVGHIKRQSKRVAFSLGRVVLKGDSPFASPHAVISISADWISLPDGRWANIQVDPAPRTDDLYARQVLQGEYWPQQTMLPPSPPAPLTDADREAWERLFKIATNKRVSVGRLAGSSDGDELMHNSLATMRDVLSLRQTVGFADQNGPARLQEAATAIQHHSPASFTKDDATLKTLGLTFAAAMEVGNLYHRTHRGIRGWERRKQIAIYPGVVMYARVVGEGRIPG